MVRLQILEIENLGFNCAIKIVQITSPYDGAILLSIKKQGSIHNTWRHSWALRQKTELGILT